MTVEREERERLRALENINHKITGVLDPLTDTLVNFEDETDLEANIDEIYRRLDADGSGGV